MAMSTVTSIATAVRDAGGRALIVGGWVRDRILGLSDPEKSNVDLEVFGVAGDRLRALLETYGRVEAVGESFQVYKIGDIDVSLPRRDSKAGRGHRGFVVTGDPDMSIAEAARRRDFTVNAISWDPLTGEYFDPFDGRADLERRLLRVVDPHTFGDDSLRVLRGDPQHLPADVVTVERVHVEAIEQRACRRDALLFVIERSDPAVDELRRRRLAEVVADRAKHDSQLLRPRQIVDSRPCPIDHLQIVNPHVAFGMPLGLLRAAGERLQFRKQLRDDPELHRHDETD